MFFEYWTEDDIFLSLLNLVRKPHYEHHEVHTKRTWSAAKIILERARVRGWDVSEIDLTGTETNCCIAQTAVELVQLSPSTVVYVIEEACNDKVVAGLNFPVHPNIRRVTRKQRALIREVGYENAQRLLEKGV